VSQSQPTDPIRSPRLTRRVFVGGAAAAATAVGLDLASTAGVPATAAAPALHWPRGQVFPTFPSPRHLQVANVHGLDGADQTLLTTLQGIVNRTRPEIYLEFDPVDHTWLRDLDLPSTRHADPLDLVGRYRRRAAGAIVYDPDVPDTINVATTMAGLRGAVVANATQVEQHGLRVVDDLRGRFTKDSEKTYAWMRKNLLPKCTHRMVCGLPPTQVVDVPGVTWTEVAREKTQVRDSSNRKTYTIDVSAGLGKEAVFVRFADSFPNDGWGGSIASLTATADGTPIATFKPGSTDEAPYLFDGSHSAVGGDKNRFADGGNYFIYRFEPPTGTAKLTVTVDMWNQYLISVADTAPTKVEPFPNFRDFVVATKALVTWASPTNEGALADTFDAVAPGTIYAGWFTNDVVGEWGGVELAARHSVEVTAADYYMNGTVHAGVRAQVSTAIPRVHKSKPADKIYLTLMFGEGDNIQYCQRHLRELWDDPERGKVPMNWTISPLLADIGPAILHHLQRTRTRKDLLMAGPSGAGYTYPDSWPESDFDTYAKLSGRYMRRVGTDLLFSYSTPAVGGGWTKLPPRVIDSFAAHTDLRGIIVTSEKGDQLDTSGKIPVIGTFAPVGDVADYKAALLDHVDGWSSDAPHFVAGAINAWSWTPTDVVNLVESLPAEFEVVLADEFFRLLRAST
jgi:hypothetical protein